LGKVLGSFVVGLLFGLVLSPVFFPDGIESAARQFGGSLGAAISATVP